MKIFGWMQSKITYGRSYVECSQKPSSKLVNQTAVEELDKEDVSEWLYGLLAIGTFGKNDLQEDLEINFQGNLPSSSENLVSEEVGNLQDKVKSLLLKRDVHESASSTEPEHVPLHFRQSNNGARCRNESSSKTSLVLAGRGKDVLMDNAIGKRSLSFLLKKIFVCSSGFPSGPTPRAPILESRMEKVLGAMLHKKIYPQSSSPSLAAKKYLENGHIPKSNEDVRTEKTDKGSKWIKTDSEYIVLEI